MKDYRLAWIGCDDEECHWLLTRFLETCGPLGYNPLVIRQQTLNPAALSTCDRIVIVAGNRSDSSHTTIAALADMQTIVPHAVVTGSWHIGSRRSGDGPVTHWQQPWFRWHDSWLGWFFPEVARPGSQVVNGFGPIVVPADFALPAHATGVCGREGRDAHSRLAILSACAMTSHMLRDQAHMAGWHVDLYRSPEDFSSDSQSALDAVLWDDSLLPCVPNSQLHTHAGHLVNLLARHASLADVITSLDLSRLHLHAYLQELGCRDILMKPSYSLALSNCLHYRSIHRQFA